MKNELAIELLKAIIENHAVYIIDNKDQKFNDLVGRIRAIDSDAADWIIKNRLIVNTNSGKLYNLFDWSASPQGYAFWRNISDNLKE